MLLGSSENMHSCQGFLMLIATKKVINLELEFFFLNRSVCYDNTS